ncbi:MAG: thermonuclease family protein [Thermodesulfovibrionales bacterium]|nr:thermonuclease family protein [Thermodesulfovibrionales bacterium]
MANSPAHGEFNARVYWVTDGDTIKIEQRVRNIRIEETCRMLHYNAPELHGKEKPAGKKAKRKLIDLVAYKKVRVRTGGRDKYGRLLCDVSLTNGTSVNKTMRSWLEGQGYQGVGKFDWMEHVGPKAR